VNRFGLHQTTIICEISRWTAEIILNVHSSMEKTGRTDFDQLTEVTQGSKKSDMSATTLGGEGERAFGDDVATQSFGSQISSLTPTRSWPTGRLQARFRRGDSV